MGLSPEVCPGAIRQADSTVGTKDPAPESGSDGDPAVRMHDVGPAPQALRHTDDYAPPSSATGYRLPPHARPVSAAIVRPSSEKGRMPKRGGYCSTRRLLFAGAVARQSDGPLPKPLLFGDIVRGKNKDSGRPEKNWVLCLKDYFVEFGANAESTADDLRTFGIRVAAGLSQRRWEKGCRGTKG